MSVAMPRIVHWVWFPFGVTIRFIGRNGTRIAVSVAGLVLLLLAGTGCATLGATSRFGEQWYRLLAGAGCALLAVPAIRVLGGGGGGGGGVIDEVRLNAGVPGGPWVFGIDALSALFLLIIAGVGAAVAFYGAAYFRGHRRGPLAHLCLILLVAELAVVVVALARTLAEGRAHPAAYVLALASGVTWSSNWVGAELAWWGVGPALVAVVWGLRSASSDPIVWGNDPVPHANGTLDARRTIAAAGLAALAFLVGAFALGEA